MTNNSNTSPHVLVSLFVTVTECQARHNLKEKELMLAHSIRRIFRYWMEGAMEAGGKCMMTRTEAS